MHSRLLNHGSGVSGAASKAHDANLRVGDVMRKVFGKFEQLALGLF